MERIVDVNQAFAKKIQIHRLKDRGFQRELRKERLKDMARDLSNGSICPPIMVAKIGNTLTLVDGQHRLEAWKISEYPLKAFVFDTKDMKTAATTFVKINSTSRRVTREHIINVSDDEWSVEVRAMARRLGVTLLQAHNALAGQFSTGSTAFSTLLQINDNRIAIAELVLTTWKRDKRWDAENNGVFDKNGIIKMAAFLVSRDNKPDAFLKRLLTLDYGSQSGMALCYGTGYAKQMQLRKYAEKLLRGEK